jgi:tetratricopeptide (TPR) repeat protein
MTVEQLEAHVTRNPHSGLVARLAEEYLNAGRTAEAIRLCGFGLSRYPSYATAHLVAARCFAAQGDYDAAQKHLDRCLEEAPKNAATLRLGEEWKKAAETLAPPRLVEVVVPPVQDDASAQVQTAPTVPESTLDELAVRLQTAERIVPETNTGATAEAVETEKQATHEDVGIASVTLAEIYASQGAFEAAIAVYRQLQKQKPRRAAQFEEKLRELQAKLHRSAD